MSVKQEGLRRELCIRQCKVAEMWPIDAALLTLLLSCAIKLMITQPQPSQLLIFSNNTALRHSGQHCNLFGHACM